MFTQLSPILLGIGFAAAFTIAAPSTTVELGGQVAINWSTSHGDPSPFAIELFNTVSEHSFVPAINVLSTLGTLQVQMSPSVPAGSGYVWRFFNFDDPTQVFASSPEFSVSPAANEIVLFLIPTTTTTDVQSTSSVPGASLFSTTVTITRTSTVTSMPTSHRRRPLTAAIIGGVIGIFVVVCVGLCATFFLLRLGHRWRKGMKAVQFNDGQRERNVLSDGGEDSQMEEGEAGQINYNVATVASSRVDSFPDVNVDFELTVASSTDPSPIRRSPSSLEVGFPSRSSSMSIPLQHSTSSPPGYVVEKGIRRILKKKSSQSPQPTRQPPAASSPVLPTAVEQSPLEHGSELQYLRRQVEMLHLRLDQAAIPPLYIEARVDDDARN